jgi:hypothetical protein
MRNFSFNWPLDVIDLSCSLVYQFVATFLSDMMNDLVRVVSFSPDETIAASCHFLRVLVLIVLSFDFSV